MLRMMLFDTSGKFPNPDHRFIDMMQDFTRTFDNRPASTEDFKAVAEKYMTPAMNIDGNGKLDWFFRQYVYSTGIPKYEFRYNIQNAPDGKFKLTLAIAQSGVSEGWKDILPIYMRQGDKTVLLGWMRATGRESNLEFTLPFNPGRLTLNDNEDILAEIK
jgi:hypothetical protein